MKSGLYKLHAEHKELIAKLRKQYITVIRLDRKLKTNPAIMTREALHMTCFRCFTRQYPVADTCLSEQCVDKSTEFNEASKIAIVTQWCKIIEKYISLDVKRFEEQELKPC